MNGFPNNWEPHGPPKDVATAPPSGPLTTLQLQSESVRRSSETIMPHISKILRAAWADVLRGVLGEVLEPKPGPQEAPRGPKTAKKQNVKIPEVRFPEGLKAQ